MWRTGAVCYSALLRQFSSSGTGRRLLAVKTSTEGGVDPNATAARPHRVVFTGGPCAGKTTAMALLSDRLEALGYRVLRVPEAATILINNGLSFVPDPNDPCMAQVSLLKIQLQLEDAMVHSAANIAASGGKRSVVLMDRGCMDGKAYCASDGAWEEVVHRATDGYQGPRSFTAQELRDSRYDQVICMVTAADGAEQFYTTANNSARKESVEEAIRLDKAVQEAWLGHSCLTIIQNDSASFGNKMGRAVAAVTSQLGAPKSRRGRRKFFFQGDYSLEGIRMQQFLVEETYLLSGENVSSRIRKRRSVLETDRFLAPSFKLRVKTHGGGQDSSDSGLRDGAASATTTASAGAGEEANDLVMEQTQLLSFAQYNTLLKLSDPQLEQTKKIRTHFIFNRTHFELDEWLQPEAARAIGLKTLIAETGDEYELKFPPGMQVEDPDAQDAVEDENTVQLIDVTNCPAWRTRSIVQGEQPWLREPNNHAISSGHGT